MTKPKYERRTPAQQRAILNNSCLRTLAALRRAFRLAGYYDYEKRTEELDGMFRERIANAVKGDKG